MSLFDVIKYKDINLSSTEELLTLPIELLDLYWSEASENRIEQTHLHESKCKSLAFWARGATDNESSYPNKTFRKALARYNI
jgi:hypothetical protein